MISSASVANLFLSYFFKENIFSKKKISFSKMQKLIYIAHGYSLIFRSEPLLDELFEVGDCGPVLPSLNIEYMCSKKNGIDSYFHDNVCYERKIFPESLPDDSKVTSIISFVYQNYKNKSSEELSHFTHAKDGPWYSIYSRKKYRNEKIENESIKDYFLKNISILIQD